MNEDNKNKKKYYYIPGQFAWEIAVLMLSVSLFNYVFETGRTISGLYYVIPFIIIRQIAIYRTKVKNNEGKSKIRYIFSPFATTDQWSIIKKIEATDGK